MNAVTEPYEGKQKANKNQKLNPFCNNKETEILTQNVLAQLECSSTACPMLQALL